MSAIDEKVPVHPSWERIETPESSQMQEVVYNPVKKEMYVNFKSNNSVYSYSPVEPSKFKGLKDSPSRGAYFYKHFKKSDKLKIISL
jgi:hypothetical protein